VTGTSGITNALGGALYVSGTTARIESSRFINNRAVIVTTTRPRTIATRAGGGGMRIEFAPWLLITNCTFTDNSASGDGGLSALKSGGGAVELLRTNATIRGCTFIRNWALHTSGASTASSTGGALYAMGLSSTSPGHMLWIIGRCDYFIFIFIFILFLFYFIFYFILFALR
jgi:hypothetical protein